MQLSTPDETACCNLGSVALPKFVNIIAGQPAWQSFDYDGLMRTVRMLVRNINKAIDLMVYPVPEAETSNMRHRPMSIGCMGLADVFIRYELEYDCADARELNRRIFASMYYAAMDESCSLAEKDGVYPAYENSPTSLGQFQFDLWGVEPHPMHDWTTLKARVASNGLRNSLLIGLMPTASTATILGNSECFEPLSAVLYTRRTLTGEHMILNKDFVHVMESLGLWDASMRADLIRGRGSVQGIARVPDKYKRIFRTSYEISQKSLIDMDIDRAPYVCQSTSRNLFFPTPNPNVITSALFHAWEQGSKTGSYYIRSQTATTALAPTVDARVDPPTPKRPKTSPMDDDSVNEDDMVDC